MGTAVEARRTSRQNQTNKIKTNTAWIF